MGNQLFDQGFATGAVVIGIGKDRVSPAAAWIEHDVEHLDTGHIGCTARQGKGSQRVGAAEAGNLIDNGVTLVLLGRVRFRQQHGSAQVRGPAIKFREEFAFNIHQLDPDAFPKRAARIDLIDGEGDRPARRRVQVEADGLAVAVAVGGAEILAAAIEIHHGLQPVFPTG